MAIRVNKQAKTITLHTIHTSYQMKIVQIADLHLVGGVFRVKGKGFCLLIENNCHM